MLRFEIESILSQNYASVYVFSLLQKYFIEVLNGSLIVSSNFDILVHTTQDIGRVSDTGLLCFSASSLTLSNFAYTEFYARPFAASLPIANLFFAPA